jgi:hypothetical protein
MIDVGMKVRCATAFLEDCPNRATVITEFAKTGYSEEIGLWLRLNDEQRRIQVGD